MMRLPGGKKGERQLKGLLRKVQKREVSSELSTSEAWMQNIERRLKKLENAAKGEDSRVDRLWKWMQEEQRRENWDATENNNAD